MLTGQWFDYLVVPLVHLVLDVLVYHRLLRVVHELLALIKYGPL